MVKKQFPDLNPFQVFQQLTPDLQSLFFSWSGSPRGWQHIMTFDPIDQLILYPNDSIDALYEFCDRHAGRFLTGYLSFELGSQLLDIKSCRSIDSSNSIAQFNAYDHYIQFEEGQTNCFYNNSEFLTEFNRILANENKDSPQSTLSSFSATLAEAEYQKNFNKIIDYIKAGDIYQINYTHLMQSQSHLSGKELFSLFAATNPADYAVYWEAEDLNIISLSPESFVSIKDDLITTMPIKGTRPRGVTTEEDTQLKNELLTSRKEQAELFMITDLLRNDVGKVSQIGSVEVIYQKKLQELATVFHTYAKITGRKNPAFSSIEALISMFPGGSITGCPKKRALEIINELEDSPRGIYTGSIGYILPNQDLEFNIAIRTVIQRGNHLTLGVGGGITIESNVDDEYHETFAKAQSFQNNQTE